MLVVRFSIKRIERLTGRLKMMNLLPNISVRQDKPSSGATLKLSNYGYEIGGRAGDVMPYMYVSLFVGGEKSVRCGSLCNKRTHLPPISSI